MTIKKNTTIDMKIISISTYVSHFNLSFVARKLQFTCEKNGCSFLCAELNGTICLSLKHTRRQKEEKIT